MSSSATTLPRLKLSVSFNGLIHGWPSFPLSRSVAICMFHCDSVSLGELPRITKSNHPPAHFTFRRGKNFFASKFHNFKCHQHELWALWCQRRRREALHVIIIKNHPKLRATEWGILEFGEENCWGDADLNRYRGIYLVSMRRFFNDFKRLLCGWCFRPHLPVYSHL